MANAFTARFRIVENTKRDNDKAPDRKMPIDFTVDEARKASEYLLSMAAEAEQKGTTVRVYKGKDSFDEVPGFTTWGSLWGDSGSWSPMQLDNADLPF
jgi:hypothetical protein